MSGCKSHVNISHDNAVHAIGDCYAVLQVPNTPLLIDILQHSYFMKMSTEPITMTVNNIIAAVFLYHSFNLHLDRSAIVNMKRLPIMSLTATP